MLWPPWTFNLWWMILTIALCRLFWHERQCSASTGNLYFLFRNPAGFLLISIRGWWRFPSESLHSSASQSPYQLRSVPALSTDLLLRFLPTSESTRQQTPQFIYDAYGGYCPASYPSPRRLVAVAVAVGADTFSLSPSEFGSVIFWVKYGCFLSTRVPHRESRCCCVF